MKQYHCLSSAEFAKRVEKVKLYKYIDSAYVKRVTMVALIKTLV